VKHYGESRRSSHGLGRCALAGRVLLTPLFDLCAKSGSRSLWSAILSTVLGFLFLQGLGLKQYVGSISLSVILSGNSHQHHIEKKFLPFEESWWDSSSSQLALKLISV
jgi:hypothetical protein